MIGPTFDTKYDQNVHLLYESGSNKKSTKINVISTQKIMNSQYLHINYTVI